jgi:ABC-type transport system involved in multi-copper enzyme maturation permease subunit
MSLALVFKDELKGFYKSKVMIFLWIGLPVLAILVHLTSSNAEGMPLSLLVSILVSSIGGLLSSVMLTVNIINEKDTHVYELFLIRPIKRWYLLLSKFLAVYICVSIACILAISIGILVDLYESQIIIDLIMQNIIDSFIMTLSIIAIASAFGILIGVVSPSIVVGVILVIFVGNYISSIPTIIPFVLNVTNPVLIVLFLGIAITFVLMILGIFLFNEKEF